MAKKAASSKLTVGSTEKMQKQELDGETKKIITDAVSNFKSKKVRKEFQYWIRLITLQTKSNELVRNIIQWLSSSDVIKCMEGYNEETAKELMFQAGYIAYFTKNKDEVDKFINLCMKEKTKNYLESINKDAIPSTVERIRNDFLLSNDRIMNDLINIYSHLRKEYDIEFIYRYPIEILKDMHEIKRNSKPIAVCMYGKYDPNNSLSREHSFLMLLSKAYNVIVVEADTDTKLGIQLDKIYKKFGKIQLLAIVGHGNTKEIKLSKGKGEEHYLDVTDKKEIEIIDKVLDKNGDIVFSGSTAISEKDKTSLGKLLSRTIHCTVHAPDIPSYISSVTIEQQQGKPVIKKVDYFVSVKRARELVYKGEKVQTL